MISPTLPQVSLPQVSLPHVSRPHVTLPRLDVHDVTGRVGEVGDRVGDAWSAGIDMVQDLAAAAVERFEELPDRAAALAGTVIPGRRARRRSPRPVLLAVAAIAALAAAAWWFRSRRGAGAEARTERAAEPTAVSAAS